MATSTTSSADLLQTLFYVIPRCCSVFLSHFTGKGQLTKNLMEKAVRESTLTALEKDDLQLGLLTGRQAHKKMLELYPQADRPSAYCYTEVSNTSWEAACLEKDI